MQPYGRKKIRYNYRNHPYKDLHGQQNWWEDMCDIGKKKARQEAKNKIRNYLKWQYV